MSKYWTVAERDPEGPARPFYTCAPSAEEAKSKVEQLTGPLHPKYIKIEETTADAIPEGEDWL